MKEKIVDIFMLLRRPYYRFAFGRSYKQLDAWVYCAESRHWKGDVPKGQDQWDEEWEAGTWDFMHGETLRYRMIASQIDSTDSVLDVGCGAGILADWIPTKSYLGVDISKAATLKRAGLIQADGEIFEPPHFFDGIVFNESLYYLHDPLYALKRYAGYLNPNGRIIISTYTASMRARAILRLAKREFSVLTETQVTQTNGRTWICTVAEAEHCRQANVRLLRKVRTVGDAA